MTGKAAPKEPPGHGPDDPVDRIDGVLVLRDGKQTSRRDVLAREEPLEIRLAGFQIAVTMRTPGHDFDLVAGFLITEGILRSLAEADGMSYCPGEGRVGAENIVNVNLYDSKSLDPGRWQRNLYASSSCGICGKASIDSVRVDAPALGPGPEMTSQSLYRMQTMLKEHQPVFQTTGGLHAAGIWDASGNLLAAREDIGRHNAVDKAIGSLLRRDAQIRPDSDTAETVTQPAVLLVSGRASFEVVQKTLMAGIPILAAVSAPSSLAVELAREAGMTLVGFLREGRCNVYSGSQRILMS